MSDLPKGWASEKLNKLADRITKGSTPTSYGYQYQSEGVAFVKIENVKYGYIDKKSIRHFISDEANLNQNRSILETGDILFSIAGTIGATCLVRDSDLPANTNQALAIIRGTSVFLLPTFLRYQLESEIAQKQSDENIRGGAMSNISLENVGNFDILIPPLNEQKRIVTKLEALLSRVDASKERLEKIPKILKRFRQSVLAAACSGKLTADWRENKEIDLETDLPFGWKMVQLKDYAKCSRGRFSIRPRNDPAYFNGKYPFIQIGNIPSFGGLITSHNQTLNEKGLAVSKMFPKGTVVIAIVGATIGNTGILGYDMCFTDSMVGIETGTETGNKFVEFYLRHKRDEIRESSYAGGGQPNIKLETLNPYPLPLPPLPEQKEIVRRVEDLFKFADSIEERFKQAKAQVDKLTNSILAKAFRGELVGQDEADEPAEILLKRIKAEKADNVAEKNLKTRKKAVNQSNLFE